MRPRVVAVKDEDGNVVRVEYREGIAKGIAEVKQRLAAARSARDQHLENARAAQAQIDHWKSILARFSRPDMVESAPVLSVTPVRLAFRAGEMEKTLVIRQTAPEPLADPLEWSVASDDEAITCSPTSGTGDGTVTVTVDRTGLDLPYVSSVHVGSNGGDIDVEIRVNNRAVETTP